MLFPQDKAALVIAEVVEFAHGEAADVVEFEDQEDR